MNAFLPLHSLLCSGRDALHRVCHDSERFVPWAEFSSRVESRSAAFQQRTEERWLLSSNDPQDFVIDLLALLHAGKQVVIPPNAQVGTLAQLQGAFDAVADLSLATQSAPVARQPVSPINPHAAIIDIYTSGSTGEPKQIRKTLAQFETEVAVLESLWGDTLGEATVLASAPHQHFYGLLFRLFWSLSAGRPFDCVTCAEPGILKERLARLADTVLISSPALLSRLPELIALQDLQPPPRMIFSSGGPLPATAAAEFYRQTGRAPTEVFGSTETGGVAWRRQESSDAWTTMPGLQVTRDEDGALLLQSPYLLDPAPWRMDDAVELLSDGRFALRGRLDRTVKIEEKRLSLPAMEALLLAHPWVSSAAALGLTLKQRNSVAAVVTLSPQGQQQLALRGRRATAQQLRQHLATHFEAVLLPRHWRFPDQLPFNERGKLTQAALSGLFSPNPHSEDKIDQQLA